jgi:hypothetical protein
MGLLEALFGFILGRDLPARNRYRNSFVHVFIHLTHAY